MKIFVYPEYAAILHAARAFEPPGALGLRARRGVHERHARPRPRHACRAGARQGRRASLGLHVSTVANLGAYLSHYGPFIPTLAGSNMLTGVYAIPAAFVEVKGVYTNTAPVDAYRGAGRPEAAYVIERLVDTAAREMGMCARRNPAAQLHRPAAMPFSTPLGGHVRLRRLRAQPRRHDAQRRCRRDSPRAATRRRRTASCAASAWRTTSRSAAAAPTRRRRSASTRAAASPC